MIEDFHNQLHKEDRLKHVSELPMGVVLEGDRTNVIIPECCREGWDSCPHVLKKPKKGKTNIGL